MNKMNKVNKKKLKHTIFIVVISCFLYVFFGENSEFLQIFSKESNKTTTSAQSTSAQSTSPQSKLAKSNSSDEQLNQAYKNRVSDLQIQGSGKIIALLPDDNKGSRHQKVLLKLSSGQTLLIAHNIDLAPRINTLREGDILEFYGEYEWNERGGVLHWTHDDPAGRHEDGWLKHDGIVYQ